MHLNLSSDPKLEPKPAPTAKLKSVRSLVVMLVLGVLGTVALTGSIIGFGLSDAGGLPVQLEAHDWWLPQSQSSTTIQ